MFIAILTLTFHLEGCFSLKQKRQRLAGLRDKFGKNPCIAVCESGRNDEHQAAEFVFTVVGTDKATIKSMTESIVTHCKANIDAVISDHWLEWL